MATEGRRSLAAACAELARTMAQPDAADRVVPGVAHQVAELLDIEPTAILLDDVGGPLSAWPADDQLVSGVLAMERDLTAGPTLEAVHQREITFVHSLVDAALRWPEWARGAHALGVGAWLTVPSSASGTTTVVVAATTRPRHWSKGEMADLQVLANLAAGWVTQQHELAEVRRTAAQLQSALDSRVVIEQAKGVLAGELGCSVDQAYQALRDHARRHSVTVRSVAHAVVDLGLRPPLHLPPPVPTKGRRQGAAQP
jgi:transcriptional regulator with GAF, ATPase, and Fis domain